MDGEDYPKELASRGEFCGKRKRRFCRTNKPGGERKNSKTRVAWEEAIASEDPSIQPASAVDRLTIHLASSAASRKTTKKELGEALKTAVTDAQQAREEMLMAREDATEVNRRCNNLKRRVDNLLASVCETNQLLHQTKKEAREVSLENAELRSQLEDQHLQFDVVLREAMEIAAAKAKVSITNLHCQLLFSSTRVTSGAHLPPNPRYGGWKICLFKFMISSHLLGFALQMLKDRYEKFIDKRHASQMATQRKLHQHEICSQHLQDYLFYNNSHQLFLFLKQSHQ